MSHQGQGTQYEYSGEAGEHVDGPVSVRRILGDALQVDGERHEDQSCQCGRAGAYQDEEVVPLLGIVGY